MFLIEAGTKVKVLKPGQEFTHANLTSRVTTKTNVFDVAELIIDPTGISRWVCGPKNERTIGGWYASRGYYGFETTSGWRLLVSAYDLEYDGEPVAVRSEKRYV